MMTSSSTVAHDDLSVNVSSNSSWNGSSTPESQVPIANQNMHMVRLICEVWVSLPLAVLGILGNVVAFAVLWRQQRLTTTVLLQALAIADTLVLVSSILLRGLRYVSWDAYNASFHIIFLILYPTVYFFRLADTWITVMLTIDRYIAVCHPLKAQTICTLRRTYICISAILISTLLFSLPRFFEYRLTEEHEPAYGFINTDLLLSYTYTLGYRIVAFFIVMYLAPMVLLIALNIRLMCTLRQSISTRISMVSSHTSQTGKAAISADHKTSRSVTTIVATVVTVCVVCNITTMTTHILWSLQLAVEELRFLEYYRRFLSNATNVLVTFNCATNFIIYCLVSRKFRTCLRQLCGCGGSNVCCHSNLKRHSSSTVATSYTSLFPLRVSIKNHRLTITKSGNQDL